jgi:hypothetical protein
VLKLRCNKRIAYIGRPTPPSSKRRPHFETLTCLGANKNLGGWILRRLAPGMTMLVKASSNLTDLPTDRPTDRLWRFQSRRDEVRKRKLQRAPTTTRGRMFCSNHTTLGLSFTAVLRRNTQQQQQPQPPAVAQACPATVAEMIAPPPLRHCRKGLSHSCSFRNSEFDVLGHAHYQILSRAKRSAYLHLQM